MQLPLKKVTPSIPATPLSKLRSCQARHPISPLVEDLVGGSSPFQQKGCGGCTLWKIYQNNTYRKELNCLHPDDQPRVQEKQYQPRHHNSILCKVGRYIYGDSKQSQKKKVSQNKSRLQFSYRNLSNGDHMRAPILFERERSHYLKR